MSDLSTALQGLAEVMDNIQANQKSYQVKIGIFPEKQGSGLHPSEPIFVSNVPGSNECSEYGIEKHAISMPVFFNAGDQQVIKLRALIAKYEAEKLAYYKAIDGQSVWQIVTEEDYYNLRCYMQRNGSTVEKIRIWKQHLNKFADVAARVQIMEW